MAGDLQQSDTTSSLTLLFAGDIISHLPILWSVCDDSTDSCSFNEIFELVRPIISSADFAIANLEVPLAGPPYMPYPNFSSPDGLADGSRFAGFDVLVQASNHCCDRGNAGILRTIGVLDSLGLRHTGTFADSTSRAALNPLILERVGIRVGLLNYTYGTNGQPFDPPVIVNVVDSALIARDVALARTKKLDKLIVYIHWGREYQTALSDYQKKMTLILFGLGVDIIIGAHNHVIQKMEYSPADSTGRETFVAYSLGNFLSNQRDATTSGGALVQLTLTKTGRVTSIAEAGYYLTWVHKYYRHDKFNFRILPCAQYEMDSTYFTAPKYQLEMQAFSDASRSLMAVQNVDVDEYLYQNGRWVIHEVPDKSYLKKQVE